MLWLNRAAKKFPEEANAFMEQEIIHFLMALKYRQKALGALLSDPFSALATAAGRGLLSPVVYVSCAAWIRGMLFPQSSDFKLLGISIPFPGHEIAAALWG